MTLLVALTSISLMATATACDSKDGDSDSSSTSGDGDGDPTGDGDGDGDGDPTGDGDGDGDGDCGPTHDSEGTAADGESCQFNSDCASGLCLSFSNVPADPDAVCAAAAADCSTRVTGTLRNIIDMTPIDGATVGVVGAISAAANPGSAARIAEGMTDADGRYDFSTPGGDDRPLQAIALAALAEKGMDFYLSSTGLESAGEGNLYGPGVSIHDVWAISGTDLASFSDLLGMDGTFPADKLPLGDQGGVVGLVRSAADGMPLAGATIVPRSGVDNSAAVIRYLNEAQDGFDEAGTGSSGIFVLVSPGLAEEFDAVLNGEVVAGATAGSAAGAVFIMTMDVTP